MDALGCTATQLLGVSFDNASHGAIIERLLARPEGAQFAYVVTPNADHFDRLLRIPNLRPVYQRAMVCLLDSNLIAITAARCGLATPPVFTGADLTAALLPRLGGRRVAIIGMQEADFMALARRFPAVSFIHFNPPMGLLHNSAAFYRARDFVCETKAAFTFFAVGSPVQELLAAAVGCSGQAVGIGLCVGAALQFAAGTARRAPPWMRKAGLEWAHRLAHDPQRLAGRYLISNPRVLFAIVATALREKIP